MEGGKGGRASKSKRALAQEVDGAWRSWPRAEDRQGRLGREQRFLLYFRWFPPCAVIPLPRLRKPVMCTTGFADGALGKAGETLCSWLGRGGPLKGGGSLEEG